MKTKLTLINEPVATNDGTMSEPLSLKKSAGDGGYWIYNERRRTSQNKYQRKLLRLLLTGP